MLQFSVVLLMLQLVDSLNVLFDQVLPLLDAVREVARGLDSDQKSCNSRTGIGLVRFHEFSQQIQAFSRFAVFGNHESSSAHQYDKEEKCSG